jgi:hypothetical protein
MTEEQTNPQLAATAVAAAPSAATAQLDRQQIELALSQLRTEQSLAAGLIAGLTAALVGAAVWAMVTDATGYQIGWMAVGVGFVVGVAVRRFGKGIDKSFGALGAVLALLGCLAGNLIAVIGIVAEQQHIPFLTVVGRLDVSLIGRLMEVSFSPMDLLFYGIAIYEGYKLSFRQITRADVTATLAAR